MSLPGPSGNPRIHHQPYRRGVSALLNRGSVRLSIGCLRFVGFSATFDDYNLLLLQHIQHQFFCSFTSQLPLSVCNHPSQSHSGLNSSPRSPEVSIRFCDCLLDCLRLDRLEAICFIIVPTCPATVISPTFTAIHCTSIGAYTCESCFLDFLAFDACKGAKESFAAHYRVLLPGGFETITQ